VLSAFSNAGQRCAACSRVIVHDRVYAEFKDRLLAATAALRVGNGEGADLGPLINERQLLRILGAVAAARAEGARVLIGGERLTDPGHRHGYYMAPTIVEGADPTSAISTTELFGPVLCLYRAASQREAVALANLSPYGLTASIHTKDLDRALHFTREVECGVAVINGGTYGSEPHMPFGGVKQSGTGSREPGTEAIDVYTELKNVYVTLEPR
jgi:aldehyde dehydrogenase (NAD+)